MNDWAGVLNTRLNGENRSHIGQSGGDYGAMIPGRKARGPQSYDLWNRGDHELMIPGRKTRGPQSYDLWNRGDHELIIPGIAGTINL
jgi:hypothetical protein